MGKRVSDAIVFTDEARNLLARLQSSMRDQERIYARLLKDVHPNHTLSARNLLHYLLLRSQEIRPLQNYLHACGLSSLTSSESHTMYQLNQVLRWLGQEEGFYVKMEACTFNKAVELRDFHENLLFGENPLKEIPHIMVTLSPELAYDTARIRELLQNGMSVVRINCAHDNADVWERMISNVRAVAKEVKKSCRIYMDLAGPRLRISEVKFRNRKKIPVEGLQLQEGDLIELTGKKGTARPASYRRDKTLKAPARVVVQPPNLTSMMKPGERIFFDDGKFEARIKSVESECVLVEIVRISTRKPVLKTSKGVNLPDSKLDIPSLTEEDIAHLPFIGTHADLVGYSFVSTPADIRNLREQLVKFRENPPAIILKIERLSAVENLPALLFEGMKDSAFGVMIARGDLAVEIGFERLSEVQQQILWISEAAHVPVIWATQVLENMNKTGFATRSEITDAAMASMAECVMLNKGAHVVKTVRTLVDILERFSHHNDKKRFTFRPLSIARNFLKQKS